MATPEWTPRRSSASCSSTTRSTRCERASRVLAQALMETEVSVQIGAGPTSGARSGLPTARVPDPTVGHPGRHNRAQDP
jgi:hypothetical protein